MSRIRRTHLLGALLACCGLGLATPSIVFAPDLHGLGGGLVLRDSMGARAVPTTRYLDIGAVHELRTSTTYTAVGAPWSLPEVAPASLDAAPCETRYVDLGALAFRGPTPSSATLDGSDADPRRGSRESSVR